MTRPLALALAAILCATSSLHAQIPPEPTCPGEIFITEPVCGANFINQSSTTIRGYVRGVSGTLRIQVSNSLAGFYTVPINNSGPCNDYPFELVVPLICGCMQITAVMENNPAVVLKDPIFVRQGPPVTYLTFAGQQIQLGGCTGGEAVTCLNYSCGATASTTTTGNTSSTAGTPTTQCAGGSATCATTDVVSVSGSASTTDTVVRLCGPLNRVSGVVSQTPAFIAGQGHVYPWTAAGLRLNGGQNSVTLLQAVGTAVITTSVPMCVDLTAPPRVCLTFQFPGDQSTVSTALTTATGTVTPSSATVSLISGTITQPTTTDVNGQFLFPLMLNPGTNTVQLNASLGATTVTILHTVTLSTTLTTPATTTPPFVAIDRPVANSILTTTTVIAEGRATPGATLRLQGNTGETMPPIAFDGTWTATLPGFPSGPAILTAYASKDGSTATSSVAFTVQSTSAPPPTTDPALDLKNRIYDLRVSPGFARRGSAVDVEFSLLKFPSVQPVVTLGGEPVPLHEPRGLHYIYRRRLDATEAEGATTVTVSVNFDSITTNARADIFTDFTPPSFNSIGVNPVSATTGTTVSISFTASETLDTIPLVTLAGSPTKFKSAVDRTYSFERTVVSTSNHVTSPVTQVAPQIDSTAVDASASGVVVALASAVTTTTAIAGTKLWEASDPLHPTLLAEVFVGQPIERVWFEGKRLVIGQRDAINGRGVGRIVGLDVTKPAFSQIIFPFTELRFWGPINNPIHQQVEVAGQYVVSLDVDPNNVNHRSLSVATMRYLTAPSTASEFNRLELDGLEHFAVASSEITTDGALLVVHSGKLDAIRIGPRFELPTESTVYPSAGAAQRVFCREAMGVLGRSDGGVDLLDLTDPLHPVRRGGVNVGGQLIGAAFDGRFIVVGTATSLTTIDASTPNSPRITGITPLSQPAARMSLSRPIATAHGDGGHTVFDLVRADPEGSAPVRIEARDVIGTPGVDTTRSVTIDFTPPRVVSLSASPDPARRGTTLTIDVVASELLEAAPTVLVANRAATYQSANGFSYTFTRPVDEADVEGDARIEVRLKDLVGLTGVDRSKSVRFDFTPPGLSDISIAPQAIRRDTTSTISLAVDETLRSTPTVQVGPETALFDKVVDRKYYFTHTAGASSPETSVAVVVGVDDLAGNTATQTVGSMLHDFTAPTINAASVAPSRGKKDTEITVAFSVDETLASTPVVTLAGRSMPLTNQTGPAFEFRLPLDGTEPDQAVVRIVVRDVVGNEQTDMSLSIAADFKPPVLQSAAVSATLISAGKTLRTTFSVSETLGSTPIVKVGSNDLRFVSQSGLTYTFERPIDGSEGSGSQQVTVHLEDEVGNVNDVSAGTVTFDFIKPTFTGVTATPALAMRQTTVALDFVASEALGQNPVVTFGGQQARFVSVSGLTYRYSREISGDEGEGHVSVRIVATDPAGNTGDETFTPLRTDFTPPRATNVAATPSPATTGTTVQVTFVATEQLRETPTVTIGGKPATYASKTDLNYTFTRQIDGSEQEGVGPVAVSLTDEAGNPGDGSGSIVLDFKAPVATIVSVEPNIAKSGTTVTITVDVNEALGIPPTLTVAGRQATPTSAVGNRYAFIHQVALADGEGHPAIVFAAQDPAGNRSTTTFTSLTTDFTAPKLESVSVAPTLLSAGRTLHATFSVSETLGSTPTVAVGGKALRLVRQESLTYAFETDIDGSETPGDQDVTVHLVDVPGNTADLSAATVRFDFTKPTFSGVKATPALASRLTTVAIEFIASEDLETSPVVTLDDQLAVFERVEDKAYRYTKLIDGSIQEGSPVLKISGKDKAGNPNDQMFTPLVTDYTAPTVANVSAAPSPASTGTTVTVTFDANERLRENPGVSIGGKSTSFASKTDLKYTFARPIDGSEGEGTRPISISLTDEAGNPGSGTGSVVLDFTAPKATLVSVEPAIAKVGTTVTITIDVDELLGGAPSLSVAGRSATPVSSTDARFVFNHEVHSSDGQGRPPIVFSAPDVAGNRSTTTFTDLVTDFAKPVLTVSIAPAFAKNGTTITAEVSSDEALREAPAVRFGDIAMDVAGSSGNTYRFTHTARAGEPQGSITLHVSANDVAGNEALDDSKSVTVDFDAPTLTGVTSSPDYVRAEQHVTVSFSVSESLKSTPLVRIGELAAAFQSKIGNAFTFDRRIVAGDGEGTRTVLVSVEDPAGNTTNDQTRSVTFDFSAPALTNVSIAPSYLKVGTMLTVGFESSERLLSTPEVKIDDHLLSLVSIDGLKYSFSRETKVTDSKGTRPISLRIVDLAGNEITDTQHTVVVDLDAPALSVNISPAYAKNGTQVTATVSSNEMLGTTPTARFGETSMSLASTVGTTYSFTHTVQQGQPSGVIVLHVAAQDRAGNEATDETRSVTVDFAPPVIANLDVTPTYVRADTDVSVSFSTNEPLVTTPTVKIGSDEAPLASKNGNAYRFSRHVSASDSAGEKVVHVGAEDLAGNATEDSTRSVTYDFIAPALADVSVAPAYLRAGTTLTVSFAADEPLRTTPEVNVGDHALGLVSVDGLRYRFERETKATDSQGTKPVGFRLVDRAGNEFTDASRSVVVDFDPPVVSQISVSPARVSTGTTATIQFHVNEALAGNPVVQVGGQDAAFASVSNSTYSFSRQIDGAEGEGSIAVRLEVKDLAGNPTVDESARLTTDFTAAKFANLSVTPSAATTGTTVTMTFNVDEPLRANPGVSVGGQEATFVRLDNSTYRFQRKITGDEGEGTPLIEIRGEDLVGNVGTLTGKPLTLDFRAPRIQQLSLSPTPATTGTTVTVQFEVDEPLGQSPTVTVNSRPFQLKDGSETAYSFTRTIDGTENAADHQVRVEVVDRAGNGATAHTPLTLDFTAPTLAFQSVSPAYAKVGTTVTAEILSNEPLKAPPNVSLGSREFVLDSRHDESYRFVLTLDGSETPGASILVAIARDRAGNEAHTTTAGPIVDFAKPEISNGSVSPSVGRAGTTITMQFDVSETLATTPTVRISQAAARFVSLTGRHYTFERELDRSMVDGANTVTVFASDPAGNEHDTSIGSVRADFTLPTANAASVTPTSARTGTVVTVAFSESESLATTPLVRIGTGSARLTNVTAGFYTFERILDGSEGQGDIDVAIDLKDVAGNTQTVSAGTVHTDFTHPQVVTSAVAPTIARTGAAIEARFSVSETLQTTPVVALGDLAFSLQSQNELSYVFAGTITGREAQGPQPIRATLTDLVGNETTATLGIVRTDFTAPRFAPVSISPTLAASGTAVIISFTASEELTGTPTVTVGSRDATLQSASGQAYAFVRTVDGSEGEGSVVVRVFGQDLAGNQGEDSSGRLTTDFTRPFPSAFELNPSAGREGTEIVLSFATSEPLTSTPRVFISTQPFVSIGMQNGRHAFSRVLDRREGEGTRPTIIELIDPAGNTSVTNGPSVRTDFTTPTAQISVSPTFGKAHTTVAIEVVASELLNAAPTVKLGGEEASLTTTSGLTYRYSKEISGNEPEGTVAVDARFQDLVGNPGSAVTTFRTDFTAPEFVSVRMNRGPFGVGSSLIVTVTASETLASTPTLGPGLFEQYDQRDNTYTFFRTVLGAEGEGTVTLLIHGEDLAGNEATDSSHTYVTDFTAPEARNARAVPQIATTGTTVTVQFDASETLAFAPFVSVGGESASLVSSEGLAYAYAVEPSGDGPEGSVPVEIYMRDPAGNENVDTSTRVVLDFTPPEPQIAVNPVPAREGERVFFSMAGSKDKSAITSVLWSFPDGTSSTWPVAYHVLADGPTTAAIDLLLTDAVGHSVSTRYTLDVANVAPKVATDPVTNTARAVVPLTWRTQEPGTLDRPTIRITATDLLTNMVTELTTDVADAGRFEWDTRASAESMFQLAIMVTDKDGGQGYTSFNPVVVDNRPLAVKASGAQPRYFNPAFEEPTALTFTLSEHATVAVKVVRSADRSVVATLAIDRREPAGAYFEKWTGKDVDGKPMADGEYGYLVEARDLLNNLVTANSLDGGVLVVLDTTPPATPTLDPVEPITRFAALTLTGSKEQDTGIRIHVSNELQKDGAPTADVPWSETIRLARGENQIAIRTKDRAGNLSTAPVTVTVTLDDERPAAPVLDAPLESPTAKDYIVATGTKEEGTALVVNGVQRPASSAGTWSETLSFRAGENRFDLRLVDAAGNESDPLIVVVMRTPNQVAAPTFAPHDPYTRFTLLTLRGTKQANTSLILGSGGADAVSVPLGAATTWSLSVSLREGPNSFSARSEDSIGSVSPETTTTTVLDTRPPALAFSPSTANAITTNANIEIRMDFSDQPDGSGVDPTSVHLLLDDSDVTTRSDIKPDSVSVSGLGLTTGTHRIEGRARDRAGNEAFAATVIYIHPPDDGSAPAVQLAGLNTQVLIPAFNPYEPEHQMKLDLSFRTTVPVQGQLRVRTAGGTLVRTVSVGMTLPTSPLVMRWDGRDEGRELVSAGMYSAELEVRNVFGRSATVPAVDVRVHH